MMFKNGFYLFFVILLLLAKNTVLASETDTSIFDRKITTWSQQLSQDYFEGFRLSGSDDVFPASMPVVGKVTRFAGNQIYRGFRSKIGSILGGKLTSGLSSSNGLSQSLLSLLPKDGAIRKLLDMRFKIQAMHDDFIKDMERYQQTFGTEFLTPAVVKKAILNVVGLRIIAEWNGIDVPNRAAVNAYAFLHPLTDNIIDREEFNPQIMEKISKILAGEHVSAESKTEATILSFVAFITQAFPMQQHPLLYQILQRLHTKQLESRAQKEGIEEKQILEISFQKGGLAMMGGAYLALGKLDPKTAELFFKIGSAFQLLDDLSDVEENLHEQTKTVWTHDLPQGRGLKAPMSGLLLVEKRLEESLPSLSTQVPAKQSMVELYRLGFMGGLLRAILLGKPDHMAGMEKMFEKRLALSTEYILELYETILTTVRAKGDQCSPLLGWVVNHKS